MTVPIALVPDIKDPFPSHTAGMRVNRSRRRLAKWKRMAEVFASGVRPDTFEEAYELSKEVGGQYENEARAIWDFIRAQDVRSIVEVGRNLGGNLFLMACAARNLERILSQDIVTWSLTDYVIPKWLAFHEVECNLIVADSMGFTQPPSCDRHDWDFVYIDGGHTGEIVAQDIINWKDRAKFIGFHDYADLGKKNSHRRVFRGVVREITAAKEREDWVLAGYRGRSDVVFATKKAQV